MSLPRHRALAILDECTGDHIWSPEHCRLRGVPLEWLRRFSDTFESGFSSDQQTIYTERGVTNHYHGIRDIDLALEAGRVLGVDVDQILSRHPSRVSVVAAIKQAVSDDE